MEPSNADGALQNYHCVHCENAVFATLTRLRCHYVDTHHFDPVTQVRNEESLIEIIRFSIYPCLARRRTNLKDEDEEKR